MKYHLPAIENYEQLMPVVSTLYTHTNQLSWQLLLPLFLVSIAISYSTDLGITGSVLVRLKRLFLVAFLLLAFPRIAEFIQLFGIEIAKSIDDMTGIDKVLEAASKRAESLSFSLETLLTLGTDLVTGVFVLLSFLILVIARFFLIAFQHFYWLLMMVLGPFFILGLLFESTSGMAKGLFKNMFMIAAWPVIWSVLSAFLRSMPFAEAYSSTDANFITIITLNLIIAVSLLFSPFLLSQLCEGVSLSVGGTLRSGVLKAVMMTNPKGIALSTANRMKSVGEKVKYAAQERARAQRTRNGHYS